MLHSEKLDFMGFYRFENVQKQRIILDLFSGEDVIIMLKEKMQ
jgi:putative methionine-R-sulfoxide reductase with GAF domain